MKQGKQVVFVKKLKKHTLNVGDVVWFVDKKVNNSNKKSNSCHIFSGKVISIEDEVFQIFRQFSGISKRAFCTFECALSYSRKCNEK
jgi:ribosome-associated protein YbcJ (S4-like RNA binding protein)